MSRNGLRIANDFSGADIVAKIHAAQDELLATVGGGYVVVLPTDYAQTTKAHIKAGIKLRLGDGTISNSFPESGTPPWLLEDGAEIIGNGWGTKIMNPICSSISCTAVTDYASRADNSLVGNSNIAVRDVQFIANPSSTALAESAAVQFGNVKNAVIDHCFFNGVEGYGAFQASSSTAGNHADGFEIINCVFEDVSTQQAGAINCANFKIRDNIFRPTTITSNYTVVDCECNTGSDMLRNFQIVDNIFDFKSTAIFNPGSIIQVVGGSATPYGPFAGRATYSQITGNVCMSGDASFSTPDYMVFAQGINLAYCDHVVVADNEVFYCEIPISASHCNSLKIHDNDLQGGKQDEAWHILLSDCFDCDTTNNTCVEHNDVNFATPIIGERNTSDYNYFAGNRLRFYPDVTAPSAINRDCKIDLVGAHSRCFHNVMGHGAPAPVDAPLITTIAELRSLPIPGTRDSSAPAVVLLGGYAAQADGNLSAWKYDPSYAGSDNGITAVIPQFRTSGTGGWQRANGQISLSATAIAALSLGSGDEGLEVYDLTNHKKQCWDGSAWHAFW